MAAIVVALPIACSPAAPSSQPSGAAGKRPQCTTESLLAFDPASAVLERRLLPAATQQSAESEEHIVDLKCAEQESDDACRARAEAKAQAAHPGGSNDTSIVHERQIVRARYEVDGAPVEATFEDQKRLAEHLKLLQAAGRRVLLKGAESVPAPDSPRHAITRSTSHTTPSHHVVLRMDLLLRPADGNSVAALLRAQHEALRAGLQLHMWQPEKDGSFRIEVGCNAQAERPTP